MALATRCPNCDAMFRVVSDQLKLRGGLVRCGSCRHVFDAIGSLTYIDDNALVPAGALRASAETSAAAEPATPPAPVPAPAPPAAAPPRETAVASARAKDARVRAAESAVASERPERKPSRKRGEVSETESVGVPTLLVVPPEDMTPQPPAKAVVGDRRSQADEPAAPGRDAAAHAAAEAPAEGAEQEDESDTEHEEPSFLREPSAAQRWARRALVVVAAALALGGAAQLALVYRTELATALPQARPALVEACRWAGCRVDWPMRAELLAVVGTELQAVPGSEVLELTAVVRNRAAFTVALPALELTLTDVENRPLARKVFAPVDYLAAEGLPAARLDEGLSAGNDLVIRVNFEARGLTAAGFVVYPFYL